MATTQSKEGKLRQEVYEGGLETARARLRALENEETQLKRNIHTSEGRLKLVAGMKKTAQQEITDIEKLLETDTK